MSPALGKLRQEDHHEFQASLAENAILYVPAPINRNPGLAHLRKSKGVCARIHLSSGRQHRQDTALVKRNRCHNDPIVVSSSPPPPPNCEALSQSIGTQGSLRHGTTKLMPEFFET